MYTSQAPWRDLYQTISHYQERSVFSGVLSQWTHANAAEVDWLQDFRQRSNVDWSSASTEDLCRLYAIFRVTSSLLLRFQSGRADGTNYPGPLITVDQFVRFHEALGFHTEEHDHFHPFYHEIISVNQLPQADAPISLVDYHWPCLMLGEMMFCRAGAVVEGGISHVDRSVAQSSKLFWTYRRKDRPCEDLSHGWGNNSQWRTMMRRDYRSPGSFHFNIDGKYDLTKRLENDEPLTCEEMIELVRHRSMIRTHLEGRDPFPYRYRYIEDPV